MIAVAHKLNRNGGYILINKLETTSLFSRVNLKGKRVLEVGCGMLPATMAIPLHEMPRLYVASDVDLRMVNEARRCDRHPQYIVLNSLDLAIKPASMDYIVLNGVLHHLPPECHLLEALQKLLAPGGGILMIEPNVSCGPANLMKWVLKRLFHISFEASPYGQFSRRTIAKLVTQAKLSVKEEWFASLLAFPFSGAHGRCKITPDSRWLFQILVAVDGALSCLLHLAPPLARILHWRVLYLLEHDRK